MKLSCRHLSKVGRRYCFRLVIPERLRHHFGRREIKKSLRTGNLVAAATLAMEMYTRFRMLMHLAGEENDTMDASMSAKVMKFVAAYVRDVLDTDEVIRTFNKAEPADVPRIQGIIDGLIEEARTALVANDFSAIADEIRGLLPPNSTLFYKPGDLKPESDEYRLLCRECLKGKIESLKVTRTRTGGEYDNPYDKAGEAILDAARELAQPKAQGRGAAVPIASTTTTGFSLGKAVAAFVKEKTTGERWSPKTKVIAEGVFRLLTEEFGDDADLGTINYAKLAAFRDDVVAKLPANRNKISTYDGKKARDIVRMQDVKPMSHSTLQKHMVWIGSFFKWAAKHEYIQRNPAEGLRPASSRQQSVSKERDPYTLTELQSMVTAVEAEHRAHPAYPERYWIPLIGMYSGMRLNEICQLHVEDVKEFNGVWCFDVNERGAGKQVKTAASSRVIPIHPKLEALGLLDYVAAVRQKNEPRLWSRLKLTRDGYGQQFSKWFARFSDNHVTSDRKKVFHSMRHNVADALKQQGAQEAAIAELLGHENSSITTGRYGKRLQPAALLETLKKLDYGIKFAAKKSKAKAGKRAPKRRRSRR